MINCEGDSNDMFLPLKFLMTQKGKEPRDLSRAFKQHTKSVRRPKE